MAREAESAPPAASAARPSKELVELLRFLDLRKTEHQPRARALLVTELTGLERLLERTPTGSPDRPQLVRRVAEGYVELRAAAARDEANLSGKQAQLASNIVTSASVQAIAHYEKMLDAYPSYAKRDDVLFYLAVEHGFRNDLRQVRENMFRLIKDHPQSAHVPLAYFTFGELFRLETLTDSSKTPLAIAAFEEVSKYPSPQNRAHCLSRERLARLRGQGARQAAPGYDEAAACAGHFTNAEVAALPNVPSPAEVVPVLAPVKDPAAAVPSERRTALVIGNGRYPVGPLGNPPNDARSVAAALRSANFDVTVKLDVDRDGMKRAIDDLGTSLLKGGVGLFFYAGHGAQVNGENYLVPIDAKITREEDIDIEAVALNRVLSRLDAANNRMNFVILDACRDNPFAKKFRGGERGLALASAPEGTFISYATAPGSVAADGAGTNSPFSSALARNLTTRGLRVEDVFKAVRREVKQVTQGRQTPWESSSLDADFWFVQ
ncbi:MAG TPA: caspase family protein [Polyangiaceae bacterium]|nr:caspase family protein [Polyangiaceae bacterium]